MVSMAERSHCSQLILECVFFLYTAVFYCKSDPRTIPPTPERLTLISPVNWKCKLAVGASSVTEGKDLSLQVRI